MEVNEDDVLEHALNNGLASAAKRFDIKPKQVYDVVKKFKSEVDLPRPKCNCEEFMAKGGFADCWGKCNMDTWIDSRITLPKQDQ